MQIKLFETENLAAAEKFEPAVQNQRAFTAAEKKETSTTATQPRNVFISSPITNPDEDPDKNPFNGHLLKEQIKEQINSRPGNNSTTISSPEWWCIDLGQAVSYTPLKMDQLAEAFFRFTPDVVVGKNRIFLEMSRTKKLFRLDSIQKRAAVLAEREGVSATHWQWGIGRTIPEAWVQTRWKSVQPNVLPVDALFDYRDPFFHGDLNRPEQEKVSTFYSLGLRTIQDLFKIPHDSLLVRFGSMLDQFSKNYYEGHRFPWVRFKPPVDLLEVSRWNADEWVIDAESLIFAVKPMVDRVMARLFAMRKSLKQLEMVMKLDSRAPDRVVNLQFAFPQTSSQLLLKLLREKLSFEMQRNPLTDPIMEVSFRVVETTKRDERTLEFSFSDQGQGFTEDLREKWMELVSYLGNSFQVETTEHLLPEKSWKKVLLTDPTLKAPLDNVSHLFQKRPLKLLPHPQLLARAGMFLKRNQELWKICEFSCEEKLSGYEWDVNETAGFDRTYYRVKVQAATQYGLTKQEWWVYKDEVLNKLMLHGVYA
jgi:hypothetical protein